MGQTKWFACLAIDVEFLLRSREGHIDTILAWRRRFDFEVLHHLESDIDTILGCR